MTTAAGLSRARDAARDESEQLLVDLQRRSRRVEEECQKRHLRGHTLGVFTHDPSKVAYCFLPKAGCTFWIRVFSFLHNFTGEAVDSPWGISRLKVHNNQHSHGVGWGGVRHKAEDYMRFMFVRHPFSRLWSAYLDKLFLPDFWRQVGTSVVWNVRRKSASAVVSSNNNNNHQHQQQQQQQQQQRSLACGNDVTFAEFVEYSLLAHEPHWEPIYLRCDPCQYRPTVVGSMQTFERDSRHVLRRMGLEWVLQGVDRRGQEENELTTLVDYNFDLVRSQPAFYGACTNGSHLASLLWRTFQLNGYIPKGAAYVSEPEPTSPPRPPGSPFSVERFKARVVEAFRAALPLKAELRRQKRDFLRQALASLRPELMDWVKVKYQQDMLYFGFDEDNY